MTTPVTREEFADAIRLIRDDIRDDLTEVKGIGRETRDEAKKTNGRVNALEIALAVFEARMKVLEMQPPPLTRRDLAVASAAVCGASTLVVMLAKYLPALGAVTP